MAGNGNGNGAMRQHQTMARGGEPKGHQSFGCDSFAEMNDGGHNHGGSYSDHPLGDHERSGPPGIARGDGKMRATAHSDHGPHHLHPDLNSGSGIPR
jgi:hypothetical protein